MNKSISHSVSAGLLWTVHKSEREYFDVKTNKPSGGNTSTPHTPTPAINHSHPVRAQTQNNHRVNSLFLYIICFFLRLLRKVYTIQ